MIHYLIINFLSLTLFLLPYSLSSLSLSPPHWKVIMGTAITMLGFQMAILICFSLEICKRQGAKRRYTKR